MNPARYLDALAAELTTAGWSTLFEGPEALLAFPPDPAQAGRSIRVKAGVGGVPWFITSTGDPLRPCHDLDGAAREIGARPVPQEAGRSRRSLPVVRLLRSVGWGGVLRRDIL